MQGHNHRDKLGFYSCVATSAIQLVIGSIQYISTDENASLVYKLTKVIEWYGK